MLRKRTLFLFLIAVALRLLTLGWDAGVPGTALHPDERQVGFVTERLEGWFSDPDFFAYGSLHFQAIHAISVVLPLDDGLRELVVSGRLLSVAASMAALFLGWIVAFRAWGRRTADIFLIIAAWVPLDLQQSHFATVEAHHTAWIMLALAACYWLASGRRTIAAAAAGAAVGASLAVKVASLALGLPLAIALVLASRGRGPLQFFRLASLAFGTGGAIFWLCQPWAFEGGRPPLTLIVSALAAAALFHLARLQEGGARRGLIVIACGAVAIAALQGAALAEVGGDGRVGRLIASTLIGGGTNPTYLSGVGEQVRMVMGDADLPYVRVFVNTLPVLYPLRELTLWGWGPLLVLAATAGSLIGVRSLGRRWRRLLTGRWNNGSILLVITLSWLIPMAARLSTLYVKYLRYWEPLVVPAALVAAWWLSRLPRRFRRRAVLSVVAGTVVWGLAYMWAFVDPHPHRTSARWLTPMLQPEQVVAFENWDETIGLHPEGGRVEIFSLPSYDLPDDTNKVLRWCNELDRADWVVLTSNRVVRTILANPQRFPQTARLYQLLLSGEAGFEVLSRASRGPRLFGLRWPVQMADESFVNYDFPQVVILRRTSDVHPEQLAERVARPLPYRSRLGLADVQRLLARQVPVIPPVPGGWRQLVDLTIWVTVFALLGASIWGLFFPLFRRWPDAGVGLAAVTGWILPAWLMWFGSELGLWRTNVATASWIFILFVTAGVLAISARWNEVVAITRRRRSAMLKVIGAGLGIGLLFVVVRAVNPAIFWGEKPMDFAFLNAFLRVDGWPTGEPWMAGMPLHYYYFGQVLTAFPIQVTGCSAGVGYNLMAATIPALAAVVLASLGLLLAGRRTTAAALALPGLVLLTGNLAWPWLLNLARDGKWFDLWWATSRVIPGFAIDEYPLWTALFADLHGHFVALPLMVATLAWGWLCVHHHNRLWIVASALCGIGAAVLVATNPWDLFILSGTLGVGTLVAARKPITAFIRLIASAIFSVIAAAPFIVELLAGFNAGAGERGLFLTDADFAPAWAVLRHFGVFLIPLAVLAIAVLGRRSWVILPLGSIGILAGLSFKSPAAALALVAVALYGTTALMSRDRLARLAWSLAAFGCFGVAACERFTLIDRMNTLFKVYNGVWLLLAAALAGLLLRTRGGRRKLLLASWLPLQAVAMVNLPLGIAQGWMQPRISSPRPTLDGQAYLETRDRETWFLVRALQGAARPEEAVAESAGPYYSRHTRIVMHTGQPTVVGWEWHLTQRGQPPDEIRARFADLQTLYAGRDPRAQRAVLDRYRVGWIVLGDLERETYGLDASASLRSVPGVIEVTTTGGASLYRVLPVGATGRTTVTPQIELPPEMAFVGSLPAVVQPTVRSLHRDEDGAVVVMPDGRILELDGLAEVVRELPESGCEPASAVTLSGQVWLLCKGGNLVRFRDERWQPSGRLRDAHHLVADDALWGWGPDGLWQFGGDNTNRIARGPVTAAAANGPWVAWSDGSRTWIGRAEGSRQAVGPELDGIVALAWQGSVLWALDASGLHRSGGGLLPWRQPIWETGPVTALAGGSDSMWMVRSDGFITEMKATQCPPPWSQAGSPGEALKEPRGLAVSPQGWFAVADTLNHRVRWYGDTGLCLDEFGSEGTVTGAFHEPSGLALASDGSLAVADTWNGRIQLLRTDGTVEAIGTGLFGPRGLLWMPDGSLLVADTGNRRLLRFAPPDWGIEVVAQLPAPVVGLAWAGGLVAAATPADGAIVLIEVPEGRIVRRLEIPGWSSREQQEGHLALLPSGDLLASAPQPGELWIADPTGATAPRLFRADLPGITAIAIRPDGDLLASLTWEHRLLSIDLEE